MLQSFEAQKHKDSVYGLVSMAIEPITLNLICDLSERLLHSNFISKKTIAKKLFLNSPQKNCIFLNILPQVLKTFQNNPYYNLEN